MGLCSVLGCGKQEAGASKPTFRPLGAGWSAQFDKQRGLIRSEVQRRYGFVLTTSEADVPFLQRLVDDKVYAKQQTFELQAIGVCFGDVLAKKLGLEWVLITDQWGTDPTLRYKTTGISINALTMVSKRVEESRQVNLQQLFSALVPQMEEMIKSGKYEGT